MDRQCCKRSYVNAFEQRKGTFIFYVDFLRSYDLDSKKDAKCSKYLHESHNDLPFLPERMKTRSVSNLYNKNKIC